MRYGLKRFVCLKIYSQLVYFTLIQTTALLNFLLYAKIFLSKTESKVSQKLIKN